MSSMFVLAVDFTQTVEIAPNVVTVILSLLIPIGVGIVTKYNAPVWLKQVVTVAFAAVAALVGNAVGDDGTAVLSLQQAFDTLVAVIISLASYFGLTGADINAKLAPSSGFGSDVAVAGNLPGDVSAP